MPRGSCLYSLYRRSEMMLPVPYWNARPVNEAWSQQSGTDSANQGRAEGWQKQHGDEDCGSEDYGGSWRIACSESSSCSWGIELPLLRRGNKVSYPPCRPRVGLTVNLLA